LDFRCAKALQFMSMNVNYKKHLIELRKSYYEAYPGQRLHIGMHRIKDPGNEPSQIITYVSIIEGLLRSLVIWGETEPTCGRPTQDTYKKFEYASIQKLFKEYLKRRGALVKDIVPCKKYRIFLYAIKYRNLLAHECTSLGQATFPAILEACEVFLQGLSKHAGLDNS
jgi:hypothetical protein